MPSKSVYSNLRVHIRSDPLDPQISRNRLGLNDKAHEIAKAEAAKEKAEKEKAEAEKKKKESKK
jgi:hypothetical protein